MPRTSVEEVDGKSVLVIWCPAVDITTGSIKQNKVLYDIIDKQGNYDQLIWENGGEWIHVSYKREGKNRKRKFAL